MKKEDGPVFRWRRVRPAADSATPGTRPRKRSIAPTSGSTTRQPRGRAFAAVGLALFSLILAVWLAPLANGADVRPRTPQVRLQPLRAPGSDQIAVARTGARGAGAIITLDAGDTFTMAGVICDVPVGGPVSVEVRTSDDGRGWSRWWESPLEIVEEDDRPQAFIEPVWTGAASRVQIRARGGSNAPARLTGVRVVAIDTEPADGVVEQVARVTQRLAAAALGVGSAAPARAASATPAIVTRAGWGADERLRSGSPSYAPVKMAFVHHTASGNTYAQADGPSIVRAIYAYHTKSLGWSDIGYNFLIDRYGTVYEGRYGGVSRGVVGAQAGGFNTGSTGIAVLGTFTDAAPPPAVITSLERVLAWKLGVHGLDPNGTARLTCGLTDKHVKGTTVTFPVVAGHRDANYTECPGNAFYPLLPSIRSDVARRMGAAIVPSLATDTELISPNGDGVLDSVEFTVAITAAVDWRLVVRDADGRQAAAWSGNGNAAAVTWDGTSAGAAVPDGAYTAELSAGSDTGPATTVVTVDTAAPRLAGAGAAPAVFSPNGDGQTETTTARYTPAEACAVRVGIQDMDGVVLRWLHGWRNREERSYSVAWDGRITSGGRLVAAADGLYRFDVERRDAAGNIARQGLKVTVDRTLGRPTSSPVTFSPNGDGVRDATTLGFRLTRKAAVTVHIRSGEDVVCTISLGTLAAGTHAATWDGRDGSSEYLASSRPTWTVTAVSALAESSVTKKLVVDLYRPRVYAAGGRTTRVGTSVRLGFKIVDPFSAKADVRFTVTNAKGRRVASRHPGWKPTGSPQSVSWRPTARGRYTVSYRVVDRGGNRQTAPARTVVTVR